jgi:hypothetical protein
MMAGDCHVRHHRLTGAALAHSVVVIVLVGMTMLVRPQPANAQLISPGKLTSAHSEFEGLRNCTRCHQLRKEGTSDAKCLECHEPLKIRVDAQRGWHATVADTSCGGCHRDHFGVAFNIIQLDTTAFDHSRTGFDLVEGHQDVSCRDCHQPAFVTEPVVRAFKEQHGTLDKTLLGVATTCVPCHETDDPHQAQFPRQGCDECHGQNTWEKAKLFDHNESRYRLTGKHRQVECDECHKQVWRRGSRESYTRYVNIDYEQCTDCHEDVHKDDLGPGCTDCHDTRDWHGIVNPSSFEDPFEHETVEFRLTGKHVETDCADCHGKPPPRTDELVISYVPGTAQLAYPHPLAEVCTDCHLDSHDGVFEESAGGLECDDCHNEDAWSPGLYDFERHNDQSEFELTGAHVTAPCFTCHQNGEAGDDEWFFRFETDDCLSCHERDDPHQQQFKGVACEDCHATDSFAIASFDHDNTEYPLDGEHRDVACEPCHPQEATSDGTEFVRYKPLGTECRDCHEAES